MKVNHNGCGPNQVMYYLMVFWFIVYVIESDTEQYHRDAKVGTSIYCCTPHIHVGQGIPFLTLLFG